ncbi:4-hydroxythreonine-4-phosphate dehydrogenase [Lachnospiraceae bacterium PF1-22]|uniref:4-hydroxythreonine-4-phosphate dehydrogenase PdxA n=1 Tax=Ohessyouella blattaphilus TaxID=2949333 RepID=UPI003E2DA8A6
MYKPIIGITLGDPAGVGPEITVKALSDSNIYKRCRPLVIGDTAILKRALEVTKHPELQINTISKVTDAKFESGTIDILDIQILKDTPIAFGKVQAQAGNAAFCYVEKVIALALDKEIEATVTNPLNKEALNLAGHHFSGHTEIYAHYTNTNKYTMMLAHEALRVVHVSTHVSLRKACDLVKKKRVLEVIRIANQACLSLGIQSPRIAVAGLNPHSGENGMFGDEETEEIIPAIEAASAEGLNVVGPIPADTVFSKAKGGWYDIVVAMYHDQGHIPLKVVGFVYNRKEEKWDAVSGVNITLGLPIIRTSVDHGTAFDQAGTGQANELSLINAIDYAILLASNR